MNAAPDTLTELNDTPVYRANRELASDLAACMSLSALLDVSTRTGTFFVTTVDPDRAFVRWGRYWNVITCRVDGDDGWMVCGRYVVIPEVAA